MLRECRALLVSSDWPTDRGLAKNLWGQDAAITYEVWASPYVYHTFEQRLRLHCQSMSFDVVVLELGTADLSWLGLLDSLRQPSGEDCPPVVVVGGDATALAVKAFRLGAADYLIKGQFTPAELAVSVKTAIAGAGLARSREPTQRPVAAPSHQPPRRQSTSPLDAAAPPVAEVMPQMVWRADAAGTITYWNQRWFDYTGLSAAESRQWHAIGVLHPDDREGVLQAWQRSIAQGTPFDTTHRIQRQDGTYHWFLNRAVPTCDRQNQPVSWTGTLTDIDPQKQLEERSQLVIRAVNGLVFDWDLSTNSLYRSEQLQQLVGVYPDAATPTAKWWRDRIHPEDMARIQPQLEALFTTNSSLYEGEYRVRHADGRWIDVRERSCLVRDSEGQVVRIVGSTVDISEHKRIEAALADNESRLQSFVNANIVGILYGDAHGYIYKANDELLRIIGYSRDDLAARRIHWADITPPEWLPADEYGIAESRQMGACTPYEKEYLRKDGSRVPVLIGYSQVGETREETVAFVLDLSALKAAEAQRERLLRREQAAREEAERASRIKDEFLTVLSHELRTPLNSILGWAKLLQTRQLDEAKTALALSTIERNARLQAQLVDNLLDTAKILQGKLALETAPLDLRAVIAAALDTVKPAAAAKSIALCFAPEEAEAKVNDGSTPDPPPVTAQVIGDRARLQQIVWNLLSNAIKFTPAGGRVEVQIDPGDRQVNIVVKDTGQGIKPEFLPRLFESFRQEDFSITRHHGGLGLGLSIVRYLVEAHGGTIAAASPGEGLGATFTVSLPVLKTPPDPQPSAEPDPPALNDVRILLVDDHLDTLELLATLLTQYGATVLAVNSAVEAIESLETFQPDLLVSDIGMPGADGHTLIQGVRALPADKGGQVPALAFTSYCQDDDYQQVLSNGYQRLIAKPLEIDQLIKAIAGLARSA